MKKFCLSLLLCSSLIIGNAHSVAPVIGATIGRVLSAAAVLNGALAQAFFAVTTVEYLRAHGEVNDQRKLNRYLERIAGLEEGTAQSTALQHLLEDRKDQYGSDDTDHKGIGSNILWGTFTRGAKNAWKGTTDIVNVVTASWKRKESHSSLVDSTETAIEETEDKVIPPSLEAILQEAEEGKILSD